MTERNGESPLELANLADAMRFSRSVRPRSVGLSIAPMIDMSFLLITFFVMTIRLGLAQDQEIELPHADQAEAAHESRVEIVTVRIDQAGRVAGPGGSAGTGGLRTYLENRRAGGADVKVVLRADARAPFTKVQRVMRSVATAGVSKLSLSALRLGEDSP